jgi:hypothetical protein
MTPETDYPELQETVDKFIHQHRPEARVVPYTSTVGLILDKSVSQNNITAGLLEVPKLPHPSNPRDYNKVAWYLSTQEPARQIWLPNGLVAEHARTIVRTTGTHVVSIWLESQAIIYDGGLPSESEEEELRSEFFGLLDKLKAIGAAALSEADFRALSE